MSCAYCSHLITDPAVYSRFELYPLTPTPIAPLSCLGKKMGVPVPNEALQVEHEIRLGAASSNPPPNQVINVPQPASDRRSRSRSGTMNRKPPVPILGTVEPPTPPAASASHRMPVLSTELSIPTSGRQPPLQTSGLPSNSAVTRRTLPAQPVLPKGTSPRELGSVHDRLSPLGEHLVSERGNKMRRPSSMVLPSKPVSDGHAGMDRSRSLSSRPHVPRKRDSLVLQRARNFDSSCQKFPPIDATACVLTISFAAANMHESRESGRLSMHMLAQFPTPPLPPMPSVASPVDRPRA